jgi:hypothetical protein
MQHKLTVKVGLKDFFLHFTIICRIMTKYCKLSI